MKSIISTITIGLIALLLPAGAAAKGKKHQAPAPAKAAVPPPPKVEGPSYSVIQSTYMPQVVSPPVPQKIDFAGEHFDFDRTDMWERLDRELTQMCFTHSTTLLMLKRANRYLPIIAPILRKNGVPEDLGYLACIESSLNPRAYSSAKAAGIWQFMPATAKQYGLEVNDYVDERYHIEKATAAAARYLKTAHDRYGNWESAMASYNGGTARITKELDAQIADTSFDLHLVEETTRYPYRVLAAKTLMENPTRYGYHLLPDQFYAPEEYTAEKVTSTIDNLPQWALDHGTTYAMLREYNPWLRAKSLPVKDGKSYTIKVPTKKAMSKSANKLTKNDLYNPDWVK